ncbi:MAG: hypothetical protein KDD69_00345 [Bdellovibrionales bacterium]|nr:hypothetical protein [Bdellovibrionales bacterium]
MTLTAGCYWVRNRRRNSVEVATDRHGKNGWTRITGELLASLERHYVLIEGMTFRIEQDLELEAVGAAT